MPILETISQGLGGIAGLASQFINNRHQMRMLNEQNRANTMLANYQYGKQREMWDEANRYNSPQAQMERYKMAGLNPNLIYGQGSPGLSASTAPKYESPNLSYNRPAPVNPAEALNAMMSFKIQQQQLENLKAERRSKDLDNLDKESRNFFANTYYGERAKRGFLSNQLTGMDWNIRRNVTDENVPPRQEYINYLLSKWATPAKQLENYNTQIALANARKDLTDLEISWFTPRWLNSAIGAGSNLLSKAIPWRGVTKSTKTVDIRGWQK